MDLESIAAWITVGTFCVTAGSWVISRLGTAYQNWLTELIRKVVKQLKESENDDKNDPNVYGVTGDIF